MREREKATSDVPTLGSLNGMTVVRAFFVTLCTSS